MKQEFILRPGDFGVYQNMLQYFASRDQDKTYKVTFQEYKRDRSLEQNALSHAWYHQVSRETHEDAPDGIKRFCKLRFGVPILRAEDEEFRELYDKAIKHTLTYEEKLAAMEYLPVTSHMNTRQMSQYLEDIQAHFAQQGVALEFPKDGAWL